MRASPRQKLQLSQQRQHAVLPRQHAVIARPVTCTAANPSGKQPQSEEETDLVTRWVGKIFGKQAIEDRSPGGLKRVDWSKVKDLEVIMDREAAPVAGDDCYMALFRPLLAGTTLEAEPLRLAYSATEDGWTPEAFHSKVDGYGSAVVLARSEGGALFGGYNPLGYDGFGQKSSMGAFLFTWPDGDASSGGSTRKKPFKLPKVQTDQLAVVDNADAGPQFGAGDLKMLLQAKRGDPLYRQRATCKLIDYAKLPGGGKSLFNTSKESGSTTQLVELRVYVRKGGKLKYELQGLKWVSSYDDDGGGQGPPPTGIINL